MCFYFPPGGHLLCDDRGNVRDHPQGFGHLKKNRPNPGYDKMKEGSFKGIRGSVSQEQRNERGMKPQMLLFLFALTRHLNQFHTTWASKGTLIRGESLGEIWGAELSLFQFSLWVRHRLMTEMQQCLYKEESLIWKRCYLLQTVCRLKTATLSTSCRC